MSSRHVSGKGLAGPLSGIKKEETELTSMRNLKILLDGAAMLAPLRLLWAGEQPTPEWETPTDALPGTLIHVFDTSTQGLSTALPTTP
jgi:hypothetical protein